MANSGKEFTPEMVEFVVRLKQHFDLERKTGKIVSTRNPTARTAAALGIWQARVKRIMARYNDNGKAVNASSKLRGRPSFVVSHNLQPVVREYIRSRNLQGQRVSAEKLRHVLQEEYGVEVASATFWRALKRWGFIHGAGKRRNALKEQSYVLRARRQYLRIKRANRNSDGTTKRPEIYLDETYVNKNHSNKFTWYLDIDGPWVNKPSGVGPRLIIVNAISTQGWVENAQLVFEAKRYTGDYHGQMNWENFSKWFTDQLLPNIPKNSLIILDNAKYHNVFVPETIAPSQSSKKDEIIKWLTRNEIPFRDDMLKSELTELCRRFANAPEFKLDRLAQEHGHTVLRTPPYHPELQPIETCWAIVKNELADQCDFTMANLKAQLPLAFSKVTAATCRKIIGQIAAQEDKFWLEDEDLEKLIEEEDEYTDKNESYSEDDL